MSSRQHGGSGPRDRLTAQLEPIVEEAVRAAGFELEQLDVRSAGRRRVVRVVVDSENGVNLDEVADASRSVAAALDAREDVLSELSTAYTLEVSSRGLDAPLTRPRHWRHTRLRLVKVRLSDGSEFVGRVGDADDEGVQLLVGGALRRVSYTDIARAKVEIEFREPPAAELAKLGANDTTEEESK